MPNYVFNSLTIKAEHKDLILNKEREVDFNILCPRPESFDRTISPTREEAIYAAIMTKDEKEQDALIEKYIGTDKKQIKRIKEKYLEDKSEYYPLFLEDTKDEHGQSDCTNMRTKEEHLEELCDLGNRYMDNIDKYGVANWYDWSLQNWGVKWNAQDTEIDTDNNEELTVRFVTAWGVPSVWLEALAKEIDFELVYEEESGDYGTITSQGILAENIEGNVYDDMESEEEEER